MSPEEYLYMEQTLAGKRGRDPAIEATMTAKPEGKISRQAIERQRQIAARTPEEREMEQREFSLKVYGKTHMQYYAKPLTGQGPLYVPGDQIKGHSAEERPVVPAHLKLKCHHGEPIRQVLQLV